MLFVVILIVAFPLAAALALVATWRHKKSAQTTLEMIGRVATVERDLAPEGAVLVGGELMPARSLTGETILRANCARVRVVGARGHCLEVEPES
ncbi:MAG: NfeD-like C-terminal, partner-binding [Acidobacteriota bacterium]|nr:NfeD-like C-terminal, partner-binding [Acidobacteriota bacterium]